ncbi:uncharacterized protein LOC123004053, partial [Tribolium madens]|uniref:uncharacterized protein LOC123004053 n=1 Tax=Tribolium madens TaxID=41895 RepID=UPI001CF76155
KIPAINLSEGGRFVVLSPNMQFEEKTHFQCLSNLKIEESIYEDILNNFTISLEGQREIPLRVLLHQNKHLENIITTDHLVEMLEGPLLVGKAKEVLPPHYVTRTFSRIMIKLQYLIHFHENTVIIISHVQNLDMFKLRFKQNKIVVLNTKEEYGEGKKVIYVCQEECASEQFQELCSQNPQAINCHHFRYFNESLEWIRSKNGVEELREFQLNSDENLEETEFFDYPNNNLVNVICENPGMGKTVLMKSLKINRPSKCWTILIYSRNHASYFRKNGSDVENFLNYIVNDSCKHYTCFEQTVLKSFVDNGNFELIWDGLDELSDVILGHITDVINGIMKKGHRQWITSRNNLVQRLEREFSVFSRPVHQFSEEEQKKYIRNRLSCSEDELSTIFQKIQSNIQLLPKNTILGIPLQIYMITELFFENIDKYLALLSNIFTVADLYEHFVEKIIYDNYKEKKDYNFDIDANWEEFEANKITMLDYYQKIAVQVYLKDECNFDPLTQKFLTKIKNTKDPIGFIINVTEDDNPQFLHNSYGEYFAALCLTSRENFAKIPNEFYVNEWYHNIRFFLDLILAKNCKAHIAVLYKNSLLLEQCTENDILQKDKAERSSLEVSCAWSKKYPQLETMKRSNYYFITNAAVYNLSKEIFENFDKNEIDKFSSKFDKCDLWLKKILLLFPFMIPFCESILDDVHGPTLLYYAVKFDYGFVFSYFNPIPFIKISNSSTTLLDFAIETLAFNCIKYLMSNQLYKNLVFENEKLSYKICLQQSTELLRIFIDYGWDLNQLHASNGVGVLHYVCNRGGDLTIFYFLLKNRIQVNKPDQRGKLPIHYACLNNDMYVVEMLLMNGARGDIPDENGKTVIHYACQSEEYGPSIMKLLFQNGFKIDHYDQNITTAIFNVFSHKGIEIVKTLVENGLDMNISDQNGNLAIHHACMNEKNGYKIIKFLLEKGVKINKVDANGKLLIHFAAQRGWTDILLTLIQNGADLNPSDCDGKRPIHYACDFGHIDSVGLLIQSGTNVHLADSQGRMPLHYACRSESIETVTLLIQSGATVNVKDKEGIMPIYYSTQSNIIKLLIQNGASVDMPFPDGRVLIHFAAAKGWTDIAMFLIQKGTDVNVCDKNEQMPLHYACRYGFMEVASLLIQNGAKISYNKEGQTPIHLACKSSSLNIIQLFIQEGVNMSIPDKNGKMPIHIACELDTTKILKELVENGCEIEVSDYNGLYPIHYACRNIFNGDNLVKFLTLNRANVNVVGGDGKMPIHDACQNEDYGYDIVRIIYSRQNTISIEDYKILFDYVCKNRFNGFEIANFFLKTPKRLVECSADEERKLQMCLAFENNRSDILKLIITSGGVSINESDSEGKLPIHIACEKDWPVVTRILIERGSKIDVVDNRGRRPVDCVPKDSLHYREFLKVLRMNDQE